MLCKNFEFSLIINGGSVKEYEHNGHTFIEGKTGSDFSLRFKNNTHQKCMAVITVDGKSILDGAPGNINESGGYIVDPYSSIVIPGWRLNNASVAKFAFANPKDSYAAQGDNPEAIQNVGVIGCAVFNEELIWNGNNLRMIYPDLRSPNKTDIWYGWYGGHTTATFGDTIPTDDNVANQCFKNTSFTSDVNYIDMSETSNVDANADIGNLGTAFGSSAKHTVKEVTFTRSKEPETVFTLYYDTRAGLEARGVPLKPIASICPSPFPANEVKGCKPPKNWKP